MNKENYAGRHLIIDGVYSTSKCTDMANREFLSNYLEKVTDITGMTLVFPPIAMSFPFAGETNRLIERLDKENKCTNSDVFRKFKEHISFRNTQGGGVSAIAVWVESHCTLHSWTEKNYISIDLFSCSNYDIEPVISYTVEELELIKANFVVVDRMMDGTAPNIEQFSLEQWNKCQELLKKATLDVLFN